MKLLAMAAFNLKGADSDAYEAIKDVLCRNGLSESVSNDNNVVFELPETTYLGVVEASSSKELKERLTKELTDVLRKKKIAATYIISVSDDWSITMGRTKPK